MKFNLLSYYSYIYVYNIYAFIRYLIIIPSTSFYKQFSITCSKITPKK